MKDKIKNILVKIWNILKAIGKAIWDNLSGITLLILVWKGVIDMVFYKETITTNYLFVTLIFAINFLIDYIDNKFKPKK